MKYQGSVSAFRSSRSLLKGHSGYLTLLISNHRRAIFEHRDQTARHNRWKDNEQRFYSALRGNSPVQKYRSHASASITCCERQSRPLRWNDVGNYGDERYERE
ncbi:uncharacterized protein LOC143179639 [Calliopsis andreniformis]|uniref:uncharacterized protein LOC143179639 n=1 Tax=Calliopsis andreniformis TaxID=337506 RepID=UPI003FCC6028